MDDAQYEFISDSAEKKRIGNSARHRRTHNGKRGGCKAPIRFPDKEGERSNERRVQELQDQ